MREPPCSFQDLNLGFSAGQAGKFLCLMYSAHLTRRPLYRDQGDSLIPNFNLKAQAMISAAHSGLRM
jgi:hypothetical protein